MTEQQDQDSQRLSSRSGATFVYREDGPMARILDRVERFAPLEHPVLITGETGTGKEQVARLLHAHSKRPGRLVSVNLSAIPHDLLENELFGHTRGAFTGADTTTVGYVERAGEGTLFLDEIGEIPLPYQVKLLRLIQEGEFEKVGAQQTQKSTARFVFATNRDLEEEVRKRRFRKDLYYRISSFTVHVPSLRDRKDDIPLLIDHFLWFACSSAGRRLMDISPEALDRFLRYDWPGNVRELENIIYRLVALVDTDTILPEHLPDIFRDDVFAAKQKELDFHRRRVQEIERELYQMAMIRANGNLKQAAEMLGISRTTLQYRLQKAAQND